MRDNTRIVLKGKYTSIVVERNEAPEMLAGGPPSSDPYIYTIGLLWENDDDEPVLTPLGVLLGKREFELLYSALEDQLRSQGEILWDEAPPGGFDNYHANRKPSPKLPQ